MDRKIIAYKSHFNDFFKTLDAPTQDSSCMYLKFCEHKTVSLRSL